jgi:hypothetical protein
MLLIIIMMIIAGSVIAATVSFLCNPTRPQTLDSPPPYVHIKMVIAFCSTWKESDGRERQQANRIKITSFHKKKKNKKKNNIKEKKKNPVWIKEPASGRWRKNRLPTFSLYFASFFYSIFLTNPSHIKTLAHRLSPFDVNNTHLSHYI